MVRPAGFFYSTPVSLLLTPRPLAALPTARGFFIPEKSMFTMRHGEPCLVPSYNMSNALSQQATFEAENYKWEQYFWEKVATSRKVVPPKPCIYKRRIYFTGGLVPKEHSPPKEGFVYIADPNCNHILVPEIEVRQPNDAEFNKFFRPIYEQSKYRIQSDNDGNSWLVFNNNPK